jgi:hypothetical protein
MSAVKDMVRGDYLHVGGNAFVENRIEIHQKIKNSQTLVAHICNPSFLGG